MRQQSRRTGGQRGKGRFWPQSVHDPGLTVWASSMQSAAVRSAAAVHLPCLLCAAGGTPQAEPAGAAWRVCYLAACCCTAYARAARAGPGALAATRPHQAGWPRPSPSYGAPSPPFAVQAEAAAQPCPGQPASASATCALVAGWARAAGALHAGLTAFCNIDGSRVDLLRCQWGRAARGNARGCSAAGPWAAKGPLFRGGALAFEAPGLEPARAARQKADRARRGCRSAEAFYASRRKLPRLPKCRNLLREPTEAA